MDLSNLTIAELFAGSVKQLRNQYCGQQIQDPSVMYYSNVTSASDRYHGMNLNRRQGANEEDYPLFESSTQVVKYLFDISDDRILNEESRESSSSGCEADSNSDLGASPQTSFLIGSPEKVPKRGEIFKMSDMSFSNDAPEFSASSYRFGAGSASPLDAGNRPHPDESIANDSGFFLNSTFMDAVVGQNPGNFTEFVRNDKIREGTYQTSGQEYGKLPLLPSPSEYSRFDQTKSAPSKKPPNLVLNNLQPNMGSAGYFPYPYSNVAGAIKSPNPREGLLGESPFHYVLPGMVPPGYVPSPMGFGIVAPGCPNASRMSSQPFFQFPPNADYGQTPPVVPMGQNGMLGSHWQNQNSAQRKQPPAKFAPVVPMDRASAAEVPLPCQGTFPYCNQLDGYGDPRKRQKITAIRHIRNCLRADQLETVVETADYLLKALENQRKNVEAELAMRFPGRRICTVPTVNPMQYCAPGGNYTPLDKLILACSIEHTKVMTIIGKIEGFLGHPVHPDVREDVARFKAAFLRMQNARKEEIARVTELHEQGIAHSQEGLAAEYMAFESVLLTVKEFHGRARAARSAVYSTLLTMKLDDSDPALKDAIFVPTKMWVELIEHSRTLFSEGSAKQQKEFECPEDEEIQKIDVLID
ncbi:unnamed protein product [Notodromas monacha]|uniref:Uncharacterized protein n=1 Tax=Notodromas monacha TaxID=399045 RepID=A0A7R9BLQ8_9CRUS|nr:unnamed protein product [Notodromas monacha]CAG0917817.1 unnamed protein product [Notodromas monacha]